MRSRDPLHFPGYAEKLTALEKKTGLREAVITGTARIGGYRTALGVMDNRFIMASMGSAAGREDHPGRNLPPAANCRSLFSAPRAVPGCRRESIP